MRCHHKQAAGCWQSTFRLYNADLFLFTGVGERFLVRYVYHTNEKFAATLHHLFNIFATCFLKKIILFILKHAKSPDFASQSCSSNLQFNISKLQSCLSVLKILSDTQQILEEVNVQRGITLLADGTCHHDRTGNTTDRKNTLLVRIDTEKRPNIAIILQIHKAAPSRRGSIENYQSIKNDNLQTVNNLFYSLENSLE